MHSCWALNQVVHIVPTGLEKVKYTQTKPVKVAQTLLHYKCNNYPAMTRFPKSRLQKHIAFRKGKDSIGAPDPSIHSGQY
jgi:hypothetical protein